MSLLTPQQYSPHSFSGKLISHSAGDNYGSRIAGKRTRLERERERNRLRAEISRDFVCSEVRAKFFLSSLSKGIPLFSRKGRRGPFLDKIAGSGEKRGEGGSCTFLRSAFARRGEGGESHLLRKEGERGRGTKKEEEEGRNWANNLLSGGGWGEKGGLEEGKGRGNCIHPLPFRACLLLLRSHIVRRGCCRMEEEGEEGHITGEEEPGNEVSLNLLLGPEGGRRLWKLVGGGPASFGLHTEEGGVKWALTSPPPPPLQVGRGFCGAVGGGK